MKRISFGREVTSHLEAALEREWLVTNGIGGYASASIAMANTRRFHGLLVAALQPPLGRTLLIAKLEATARLGGDLFPLTTNEYRDGTTNPHGYQHLESFALEGTMPVFTWAVADNRLEQRVWMAHGHNTTYVTFTLVRASRPIALEIVPLCTYRAAAERTDIRGWMPDVRSVRGGLRIDARLDAVPYWLRANRGSLIPGVVRHWSLRHRGDSFHGLADSEDLFATGRLDTKLDEGETLALILTTEEKVETNWQSAYGAERERQARLLERSGLDDAPGWVHRLVLAADQFVVDRPVPDDAADEDAGRADDAGRAERTGKTILAGYPWYGDQSRDTMIALPGLTLVTGRTEIAASILRTCARFVHQGMLPDRFPTGEGMPPPTGHGAADAALWFFHALYQYLRRSGERALLDHLYPSLTEMLEWHLRGTHHGLEMDEVDGLLRIGDAAAPLTWMNARDGEQSVTPRTGKPVELNALWHNALGTLAYFCGELGENEAAAHWQGLADRAAASFEARFWHSERGCLYDVVDGPEGDDARLRPNQILAVALPFSPLRDPDKARAVVDTVAQQLHTSYGLRTLEPREPKYARRYVGGPAARAAAYHQGTAWAWLMGPFVAAHLKVYGDREKARSFVLPFADHLADHGLGSISEIFDAEPPHTPRGAIASAWSVAQVLCSWLACSEFSSTLIDTDLR